MPLALGAVGVTALLIAIVLQNLRRLRRLPAVPVAEPAADEPLATILIPARNEARVIERCVRGALAQRHPNFEVLVVDDGSTDGTSEILRRLQREDARLRVLAGELLPPGWKGKPHALCQGFREARGDWLLMLDADTAPQPYLLPAMLDYARTRRIEMLSVLPLLELGTFWEQAILPAFSSLVSAAFPFELINDPASDVAIANGQCILITREAYAAVGGHEAVRDEIAEDLELARVVKRAGRRLVLADGRHLLRVRMYQSGAEVWEGLTKNAMAGVTSDVLRVALGTARQTLLALGALGQLAVALWAWRRRWPLGPRRLLAGSALISAALSLWSWGLMYRKVFEQPAWRGLLYPLGIVAYGLIGLNAALRLRFGHGVTWKGRKYEK